MSSAPHSSTTGGAGAARRSRHSRSLTRGAPTFVRGDEGAVASQRARKESESEKRGPRTRARRCLSRVSHLEPLREAVRERRGRADVVGEHASVRSEPPERRGRRRGEAQRRGAVGAVAHGAQRHLEVEPTRPTARPTAAAYGDAGSGAGTPGSFARRGRDRAPDERPRGATVRRRRVHEHEAAQRARRPPGRGVAERARGVEREEAAEALADEERARAVARRVRAQPLDDRRRDRFEARAVLGPDRRPPRVVARRDERGQLRGEAHAAEFEPRHIQQPLALRAVAVAAVEPRALLLALEVPREPHAAERFGRRALEHGDRRVEHRVHARAERGADAGARGGAPTRAARSPRRGASKKAVAVARYATSRAVAMCPRRARQAGQRRGGRARALRQTQDQHALLRRDSFRASTSLCDISLWNIWLARSPSPSPSRPRRAAR